MSDPINRLTPSRRKWWRRVLALIAVALLVWLASSFAVAFRLTPRQASDAGAGAAVLWGTVEPLNLATADGQTLGAWFFPGRTEQPTVVLLHGNGESRTACLPQAELLASAGYPILAVTLRAHGDSTGAANDFGYSARSDLIAAVKWLEAPHRPGTKIVVWGQSLGSAAALFAAHELGARVRGYVLECPYRDLRTAVRNRLRIHLPPVLDTVAYAGLRVTAPLVLPDFDRISPLDAAAGMPPEPRVLVLSGTADRRAAPDEARSIAERIGPRAELVVFEGGDHLQLATPDPDRYRAILLGFLERCCGTIR